MDIKVLFDNVAVKLEKKEATTKNGVYLPDSSLDNGNATIVGEVVAVGEARNKNDEVIPLEVKEGDRIVFRKYAGSEVEVKSEKVYIISQKDILAILQ
jgi:chaperonin GroES